jgi:hypothetical protein
MVPLFFIGSSFWDCGYWVTVYCLIWFELQKWFFPVQLCFDVIDVQFGNVVLLDGLVDLFCPYSEWV